MNEFLCKIMKNVDLESNWDYACFIGIVRMSYFSCYDFKNWMCLVYGGSKGILSVSIIMGCYLHIAQVWPRIVLDDGHNVTMWFM